LILKEKGRKIGNVESVNFVPEMKMVAILKGACVYSDETSLILMKDIFWYQWDQDFLIAAKVKSQEERALATTERKEMRLKTYARASIH
jgi:hypothetical protein